MFDKGMFTLIDLEFDDILVVMRIRERFCLLTRDRGVSFDHDFHIALFVESLVNRVDVLETDKHIVNLLDSADGGFHDLSVVSARRLALDLHRKNASTHGNCFIWVNFTIKLLAGEVCLDHLIDLWNAGRSSDEHNIIDVILRDPGFFKYFVYDWDSLRKVRFAKLFKLSPRHRH